MIPFIFTSEFYQINCKSAKYSQRTKFNWMLALSLIAAIDNRIYLAVVGKMGDGKSAPVNKCAKSTIFHGTVCFERDDKQFECSSSMQWLGEPRTIFPCSHKNTIPHNSAYVYYYYYIDSILLNVQHWLPSHFPLEMVEPMKSPHHYGLAI